MTRFVLGSNQYQAFELLCHQGMSQGTQCLPMALKNIDRNIRGIFLCFTQCTSPTPTGLRARDSRDEDTELRSMLLLNFKDDLWCFAILLGPLGLKRVKSPAANLGPLRTVLIPVSLAWSNWENLLPPGWDASSSQAYPQQYIAGTHLYTWAKRDSVE